jgi:ribosomal protein L6P/L9E
MKPSLFFLNLRLSGIGFRAYIVKKVVDNEVAARHIAKKSSNETSSQLKQSSRSYIHQSSDAKGEVNYIKLLILKVGQSALTSYPIPQGINIFCPTDQQQQADNQPLLLTSDNLQLLTQVAAEIKSYRKPDPYKGSGIYLCNRFETDQGEIYENEIINRKVIKKK